MTLKATFICLLIAYTSRASIAPARSVELDSLTSMIDKRIIRDFHKVHHYLDSVTRNDEEKVWVFYGFIGIHCKYDYDRKNEAKRKYYTPEYTNQRLSGVCEDFAGLFKAFCDKSKITCFLVHGKVHIPVWEVIRRRLHGIGNTINHAWNVVRVDNTWQLMDPTWSYVKNTRKIYTTDKKNVKHYVGKISTPWRQYYNIASTQMSMDHKPVHPAFFLRPEVPTFKTALRHNPRRQESFDLHYPFAQILDSIAACPYPLLCQAYQEGSATYIHKNVSWYLLQHELQFLERKYSRAYPLTIAQCEAEMQRIREMQTWYMLTSKRDISSQVAVLQAKVDKWISKQKRRELNATAQTTKKTSTTK